ncbi:sensor histidine kinase [Dictyobacter kobayashii]|uniref:sensor histidine kinase n=1 Tax=Dictyobacter kobayashii TaxID=2014872 RepID=UPI000F81B97A|nr:ATP-binding protein [Dictyobacter kobayashii]
MAELTALVLERERLVAEQAEAQANVLAAREANHMMEDFLGIAGHELRTPLTTIKASVQLARRQIVRLSSQEAELMPQILSSINVVQDLLNRTERQVGMQSRLINDLLDVSRIQMGRLELQPDLQDLVLITRQVVEDQRLLNPVRLIQLELSAAAELLVTLDADRIRQVISNYLSNALKYSDVDQPVFVQISVDARAKNVRVAVRDSGPGLTEDQQQRVWERFYRVPEINVRSGSGVGLGLGLHITKMIIERLGGSVGIDSQPGHGSTFWFTLPLEGVSD